MFPLVRIDARFSCVLETKEVTIADVEQDLRRLYQIKAERLLEPLFNFMEIIKQFPTNEYMLRHSDKHNAQAMVYVKSAAIRFDLVMNVRSVKNVKKFPPSSTNTTMADLYKWHEVDTSILETIPWHPIDDTVCTTIHKLSGVMPCAFPHWGGQNESSQANDRLRLVSEAERKQAEKLVATSKRNERLKRKKPLKRAKAKQKKKALAKQAKLDVDGESLDPNELFDARGHIPNVGLSTVNRNQPEVESMLPDHHKNDENNERNEAIVSSESLSIETYCRDATAISDDSVAA